MATIAILGTAEVDASLATQSLEELRDAATEAGEHFDVLFSLREGDTPAVTAELIEWCQAEEVGYWLIIHPGFVDEVPEEYTNGAEKTVKTKDCDATTVKEMLRYGGSPLLVLAADVDQPDEVVAAATTAHEAGVPVLDLADALTEIPFDDDTQDATEEGAPQQEEEDEHADFDFEDLGNKADAGDANSQMRLAELGYAAGIDDDAQAELTWLQLAEQLYELSQAAEEPEDDASPDTGWTQEALDAKPLKELRAIAAASGIAETAGSKIKKALLALDSPKEGPSGPGKRSDVEIGTVTGTASATAKPAASSKAVGNGAATDDTELNHAVQLIQQGVARLAAVIAAK